MQEISMMLSESKKLWEVAGNILFSFTLYLLGGSSEFSENWYLQTESSQNLRKNANKKLSDGFA